MRFFKLLLISLFLLALTIFPLDVKGETPEEKADRLKQEISQNEENLKQASKQINTLNNAIAVLDSQIQLTTLKIQQTLGSINLLEEQIKDGFPKVINPKLLLLFLCFYQLIVLGTFIEN